MFYYTAHACRSWESDLIYRENILHFHHHYYYYYNIKSVHLLSCLTTVRKIRDKI